MSNYLKGEKFLIGYEYDFDIDGGTIGAINLRQFSGQKLDGSHVIINAFAVVEEDLASAGTPTMTWGNLTDPDGYFVDTYALLNAGAKAVTTGEVAGALIWDGILYTNTAYRPLVDNDFTAALTIGVAALTAGKIRFYLECLM